MATQLTDAVESGDITQLREIKDQLDLIRGGMLELETNALAGRFDLHESQTESAEICRTIFHYAAATSGPFSINLRRLDSLPLGGPSRT